MDSDEAVRLHMKQSTSQCPIPAQMDQRPEMNFLGKCCSDCSKVLQKSTRLLMAGRGTAEVIYFFFHLKPEMVTGNVCKNVSAEHLKANRRGEERFICTAVGRDLERSPVLSLDESFQMCKIISACREGLGGDHPAQVGLCHGHRGHSQERVKAIRTW